MPMNVRRLALAGLLVGSVWVGIAGQTELAFDVVSIKRNPASTWDGGSLRSFPDGSFEMRNSPLRQLINSASPEPVRELIGVPEWVNTDHYDIIAKVPPGRTFTRRQQNEMIGNMLRDRFKVAGHIEQRERSAFSLVLARSDGKLGPQLKPSTLDCSKQAPGPPPPDADPKTRCGLRAQRGQMVSGGTPMRVIAGQLSGSAGGEVVDNTGLTGDYAFELQFAPPQLSADPSALPDERPAFATALQEQLGLKLVGTKVSAPVFVIDHIERPTED